MKRKIVFILPIILGLLVFFLLLWPHIHIPRGAKVSITFEDKNRIINTVGVSNEEAATLARIVNNRYLMPENLSCGFDEDFSFCVGEQLFFVAKDGCNILRDKESQWFLFISESDREWIETLFIRYGSDENHE